MRRKNFLFPLSVTLLIGVALSGVCVLTADAISDSHNAAEAEKAEEAPKDAACPRCAAMTGEGHKHRHAARKHMHGCCAARADALKALDAAEKAIEADEKEAALAAIAKARKLLTPPPAEKPEAAQADAEQSGVVNTRCPIMGTKLDPAKVPAELTRQFEGKLVGFCCGGCPAAWDDLSDQEKKAKLAEASRG